MKPAIFLGPSEDLLVSLQVAGQLVTVFTLVYAISSPILTALTGGVSRRKLLLGTMGLFTLGNLVAAAAPAYWSLILARILIAACAGLYGPNAKRSPERSCPRSVEEALSQSSMEALASPSRSAFRSEP
jgi:predicted MFS family arabinose efflux permease